MINVSFILIIAFITGLIFYFIFRGKKVTLGDELVEYVKSKLRENGYTDLDLDMLEIKFENQFHLLGYIFLSIYRYDGKFIECKTEDDVPIDIWYMMADDLVERFLEIVEGTNNAKN